MCVFVCLCVRLLFSQSPAVSAVPTSRISMAGKDWEKSWSESAVEHGGPVCLCVCTYVCVHFFSQAQDWHITVNITLQPCSVAVAAPSVEVQVQASTQLMGGRNHTMLGCHWARVVKFRSNQKQLCSKCTKTPNPTPWKGNAKYRIGML